MHLHLGHSRDGGRLNLQGIQKTLSQYKIGRAVVFGIDEPDAGPIYEKTNSRVLKAVAQDSRLIAFARLNPRIGSRTLREFERCRKAGIRGVKLHPRSECFSPRQAEELIGIIEEERLPIILHSSHEKNCRPLEWEKVFRRHRKIPFILAHGAKDAYPEAIAVICRNSHVWLETSTLSYWRTGVVLKKLGTSRMVFGSDLPYSHPAIEKLKLDFLLSAAGRRKVYSDNAKQILGE